jgi:hypothetical protein
VTAQKEDATMYELPTALGLIPDLSSVAADLNFLGALWLAASALGFGALIPLSARRTLAAPAVQSDAGLPEAA